MENQQEPAGHPLIGARYCQAREHLEQLLRDNHLSVRDLTVSRLTCYSGGKEAKGKFWELTEQDTSSISRPYHHYVADDCYQRAITAHQRN